MVIKTKLPSFRSIISMAAIAAGILFPAAGFAATLNFLGDKDVLAVGDTFSVDVKVDSQDQGINAAQATVKFNQSVLDVDHVDKTGSVFNFWLADPAIDNTNGKVSFIGGSTNGFSGKSIQILRIVFKTKGTGTTRLAFNDAAVTASDGTGTNILTQTNGLDVNSVSVADLVAAAGPSLITRRPDLASQLPSVPVVTIPLYPDQTKWYDLTQNFTATWMLPSDIATVSTVLDKNPTTDPIKEDGLFTNENYHALDNGEWYLHVRFKNSVGWGPTRHYRLAIDTVPPASFDVKSSSGMTTDNPTPTISFSTSDQLSGVQGYDVRIDNGQSVAASTSSFVLPVLDPGKHKIFVTAHDQAGNAATASTEVTIQALAAPQILWVVPDVFVGEGGLAMSGKSVANAQIIVSVKNDRGQEIAQAKTSTLEDGSWSLSIDQPLKIGAYTLDATARDARGAMSLVSQSMKVTVKDRPMITLLGIDINYSWAMIFVLGVAFFAIIIGAILQLVKNSRRRRWTHAVAQDAGVRLDTIRVKLQDLADLHAEVAGEKKNAKGSRKRETEFDVLLGKIEEDLERDRASIVKEVQDID
jgi:hypothetical protein